MSLAVVSETATPVASPVSWAQFALCKGKTHLFFGPAGERPSKRRKRETLARSYCAVCPVAEPCREAGRHGRENGLWGNENEEERAAMGYAPRATERRSVAAAARDARNNDRLRATA